MALFNSASTRGIHFIGYVIQRKKLMDAPVVRGKLVCLTEQEHRILTLAPPVVQECRKIQQLNAVGGLLKVGVGFTQTGIVILQLAISKSEIEGVRRGSRSRLDTRPQRACALM